MALMDAAGTLTGSMTATVSGSEEADTTGTARGRTLFSEVATGTGCTGVGSIATGVALITGTVKDATGAAGKAEDATASSTAGIGDRRGDGGRTTPGISGVSETSIGNGEEAARDPTVVEVLSAVVESATRAGVDDARAGCVLASIELASDAITRENEPTGRSGCAGITGTGLKGVDVAGAAACTAVASDAAKG